jgi:hypothetical protein
MRSAGEGSFWVEYTRPGKVLSIRAGAFSPAHWLGGEQMRVGVRDQEGILQIKNKAKQSESVQLWWEEPGKWIPGPGEPTKDRVGYSIAAEGVEPVHVVLLANLLKPFVQDVGSTPGPTIDWKRFSNTAYDITLQYPSPWKLNPRHTIGTASFRYDRSDGYSHHPLATQKHRCRVKMVA